MQALLAVIIATALMLSVYHPTNNTKRVIPHQKRITVPAGKGHRAARDTYKIKGTDTAMLNVAVPVNAFEMMVHRIL